jgi:hypothetical protein
MDGVMKLKNVTVVPFLSLESGSQPDPLCSGDLQRSGFLVAIYASPFLYTISPSVYWNTVSGCICYSKNYRNISH